LTILDRSEHSRGGGRFSVGGDGGTIAPTETKLDILVLHDVTKMEEGECRRLTESQSQEAIERDHSSTVGSLVLMDMDNTKKSERRPAAL
jgi:hypothetical protein